MTINQRLRSRLSDQEGSALIVALMAMMLLTALGAAVVMVSSTETRISGNYRDSQEALYAADAAVERVVQDLLLVPRWNDILNGTTQSSFAEGSSTTAITLPNGGTVTLCCGANTATGQLQADTDTLNLWGANNPRWKLFAWGPLSSMLPDNQIDSAMYVAVWVADDPADGTGGVIDGDPTSDVNGTLTLHAEALGPGGTRKVIEVTVARTSSTEIERGQIAQRGQEELNQRARKAAVQTPGKTLGEHAHGALDGQSGGAVMVDKMMFRKNRSGGVRRRSASRRTFRRRSGATALFAVAVTLWWSSTAFAQLDPLLFIKRVPPTIIVVMDTSMRMLEDGSGNFYDPNFYVVSDDAAAMASFPSIGGTTKTYRRVYSNLQDVSVTWEIHRRQHHRNRGRVGSRQLVDIEHRDRPGRS